MKIYMVKRLVRRMLGLSTANHRGFHVPEKIEQASKNALETAKIIRGAGHPAAIFIHGVMPRSGTVYTGEILRLHPALHAYPNELWEIPFLELTGDIIDVQQHFFRAYRNNIEKIGGNDFLPLFGASLIAYLYSFVPKNKGMLIKIPDVQYLDYFYTVFPGEDLLLLLRDGRDVVNSTVRTWPEKNFSDVCKLWNLSAKSMLAFQDKNARSWMVKYEDVVRDPVNFAKNACGRFQLNTDDFPFEKIREISVRGSSAMKEEGKVTWNATEKPEGFKSTGRWEAWSNRKKNIFKKIAGETLIAAGYCENLDW